MDFSRSALLLGEEGIEKLKKAHVTVFGVGGVGSYSAEAIARGGVGRITLVDFDTVSPSNINRQLPALASTLGMKKTEVMAQRMREIHSESEICTYDAFCTPDNVETLVPADADFVIDAVDTVSAKIAIIVTCKKRGIPVISCMGAGNKLDPTKFVVTDIYKTSVCPLCRVMRHELRKRQIDKLTVVYSTEEPVKTGADTIGSLPFVPSVAGLIAAGHVIKTLAGK